MKKMITGLRAMLAAAAILVAPAIAHANYQFNWSFSDGGGVNASGTLETTNDPASGMVDVVAIAGAFNGDAITGLVPVAPPAPGFSYDNLFADDGGPHLTLGGLLFSVAGAFTPVNIWYDSGSYYAGWYPAGNGQGNPTIAQGRFEASAVPEPASAALAMLGICLMAMPIPRSRRMTAIKQAITA